jgi:hypothetical protein
MTSLEPRAPNRTSAEWWLYATLVLGLTVGAAAVVVPMRLGADQLQRMEF